LNIINSLIGVLKDTLGIMFKRTRNAEVDQEIEKQKLTSFNYYLGTAFMIILLLLILDNLLSLQITPWFYNIFEKILDYMIGGN
jgi:23S rRNA maturation mini-RNase III